MSSFDDLLELVATEIGGVVHKQGEQVALKLPGREPFIIDRNVNEKSLSRERLAYMEKQAAAVLLAAPVLFGAALKGQAEPRKRRTILRVAYGYHLVNAHPCFRRYTSYYDPATKRRGTIWGDDGLLTGRSSSLVERKLELNIIEKHIDELSQEVLKVHDDYLKQADVKAEMRAFAQRRQDELFDLDLLYNRKSQRHLRTYGLNPERPDEKSSSPAEEFRLKRSIVYQRHIPVMSVQILSVGVLTAITRKTDLLRLPFLGKIQQDRWLAH